MLKGVNGRWNAGIFIISVHVGYFGSVCMRSGIGTELGVRMWCFCVGQRREMHHILAPDYV
jgi:hypothetical protein